MVLAGFLRNLPGRAKDVVAMVWVDAGRSRGQVFGAVPRRRDDKINQEVQANKLLISMVGKELEELNQFLI